MDSTASGNSGAGTVPSPGPGLICGGCTRQVQAAVVQWTHESYLVRVDIWPLRKRVQQMRRRSLSAAEGWPGWLISPCQHIWGVLPAAASAACICPHLSVYLWMSGIYLSCQTISQNNCAVLLMGLVQHTPTYTGHFTPLKRCGYPSQTHALAAPRNTPSTQLSKRNHCNKENTCNNHCMPKHKDKELTTSLSVWGREALWTHKREDPLRK